MIDAQVATFAVVAAALTVTPGADTMLVVRNVLRGGARDGVVTAFGACSGLFLHAVLSAVGVSAILMHSATVFQAMKIVGGCYLVWLGLQALGNAATGVHHPEDVGVAVADRISPKRFFLEGFLSNVLNPKVTVFYLALLPQFIGPADPVLRKSFLLAGIHYVEGILWLGAVAIAVNRTRRLFLRTVLRRWLNAVCGAVLVALGARLAFDRR